ncbi:MAG: SMC-Scp complex subunit ScpB [Candidatus Altiarchaeota archaeon]|nr:SMC-Scp complex subunit ScpB [Candidatus Altiarchaeota archaeon]
MAGKRLTLDEISKILNASREEILSAVDELQDKYRGPIHVLLDKDTDTVLMTVEGSYIEELWMLGKGELSNAELRTLATIAYYEPIRQSEIVKARGNRAYDHIRKLSDMGLINPLPQGNTKLLRLTRKFYDYFGDDVAERIRSSKVVIKSKRQPDSEPEREKSPQEGGEDLAEGLDIRIRDVRSN